MTESGNSVGDDYIEAMEELYRLACVVEDLEAHATFMQDVLDEELLTN